MGGSWANELNRRVMLVDTQVAGFDARVAVCELEGLLPVAAGKFWLISVLTQILFYSDLWSPAVRCHGGPLLGAVQGLSEVIHGLSSAHDVGEYLHLLLILELNKSSVFSGIFGLSV